MTVRLLEEAALASSLGPGDKKSSKRFSARLFFPVEAGVFWDLALEGDFAGVLAPRVRTVPDEALVFVLFGLLSAAAALGWLLS